MMLRGRGGLAIPYVKRALKVLASVAIFLPSIVSADDQDVIDYREHIMKTLDEQTAAVGMILSSAVPGDNAAAHLRAIALTAQIALKAFEPKVPGGQAKPEVWSRLGRLLQAHERIRKE